ncbi:interphotoreceptor matrix proteoglycan 1-like isoform X2 [Syngnathus scovelli]|uniref:interphotoreceptor matrix proteoglycan 1-like isoform X2 n=1 Tax=Syngnathus scovelli TaxID=161590 RepID=UPI00210FCB4B|nr:interphotoreceptor matrix proteoglycan 1-like isoform X2 [Syngnathus scovelli]
MLGALGLLLFVAWRVQGGSVPPDLSPKEEAVSPWPPTNLKLAGGRSKRSLFLHSGVRICPQESVAEVLATHQAYYQLRVCQEAVWEAYRIFLDRIPATSEYQRWLHTCQRESLGIADMARSFGNSEEHLDLIHRRMRRLRNERPQSRGLPTPVASDTPVATTVSALLKGATSSPHSQRTTTVDGEEDSDLPNAVPESPAEQRLDFAIDLVDPGYRELLDDPDSPQYIDLAHHLQDQMQHVFDKLPGFKSILVLRISETQRADSVGGITVLYSLLFETALPGEASSDAANSKLREAVRRALHEEASLPVDLESLIFDPEGVPTRPTQEADTEVREPDSRNHFEVFLADPEVEQLGLVLPLPAVEKDYTLVTLPDPTEEEDDDDDDDDDDDEGGEDLRFEPDALEPSSEEEELIISHQTETFRKTETGELVRHYTASPPTTADLDLTAGVSLIPSSAGEELLDSGLVATTVPEEAQSVAKESWAGPLPAAPAESTAAPVESTAAVASEEAPPTGFTTLEEQIAIEEEALTEGPAAVDRPPASPSQPESGGNERAHWQTAAGAWQPTAEGLHPPEAEMGAILYSEQSDNATKALRAGATEAPAETKDGDEETSAPPSLSILEAVPEPGTSKWLQIWFPSDGKEEHESQRPTADNLLSEEPSDANSGEWVETYASTSAPRGPTVDFGLFEVAEAHQQSAVIVMEEDTKGSAGQTSRALTTEDPAEEGSGFFDSATEVPAVAYLTTATVTTAPHGRELVVFFSLRVTNFDFSEDLFNKTSPEYRSLENTFLNVLLPYLQANLTGFRNLEILNFRKGSVVVNSRMKLAKSVPYNITEAVQCVLREFCSTAAAHLHIHIDSGSVDVEPADRADPCKFLSCGGHSRCVLEPSNGARSREARCQCRPGFLSVDGLPCRSVCELRPGRCGDDAECHVEPGHGVVCRSKSSRKF